MRSGKFLFLLFGLISGSVSFYSAQLFTNYDYSSPLPGLVFGVFLTLALLITEPEYRTPSVIKKVFLWLFTAFIAHFTAVWVTIFLLDLVGLMCSFFVGGLSGTTILLSGLVLSGFSLTKKEFLALIILGGILGLSFYVGDFVPPPLRNPHNEGSPWSFFSLFLIWQTGVAFALGWVMDKKAKEKTP